MKPLITTARALSGLAAGASLSNVNTTSSLYLHELPNADFLVTSKTTADEQRIIIFRDGVDKKSVIPERLRSDQRSVLSRMASFADRAQAPGVLALPKAWHQYKHNNLITFLAVPGFNTSPMRWVCEVITGARADVIFWEATDVAVRLQDFELDKKNFQVDEDQWVEALVAVEQRFRTARPLQAPDIDIALPGLEQAATRGKSYGEWLELISEDQRVFLEAPTDKSIRLRGPAGSGKTLALTLKAVRELLASRESGDDVRILMVTHSWSLATEVSDSKDALGLGPLPEIDVFPLLEVAEAISPRNATSDSFKVIGSDSYSVKVAQIEEICDLLDDFISSDWITFRAGVSSSLRSRFDSELIDDRKALAWDLLNEFGSVIGAAAIFPGAGAESRYNALARASWMLPLPNRADQRVVFELYSRYVRSLDARGLLTGDQVLADLLNDLQKHSWNRARRSEGYDLIFVDEFHLFNPLERQILHYLSRDVSVYPRIFMAFDPRQSPSEAFIGFASDETRSGSISDVNGDYGEVRNLDLTQVHRYSPQILGLVKHVHLEFPTLDLGGKWNIDFSSVESAREDGAVPRMIKSATRFGDETAIVNAVRDKYHAGRMALAIVDTRQWTRFQALAGVLGNSNKYHVSTLTGRGDVEGLGYRKRGLVVAPAEYLAGLQFDTVLVAGIPDLNPNYRTPNDIARLLSFLYLGISRAENDVAIFVNDDDGGAPDVLLRAVENGFLIPEQGSLV